MKALLLAVIICLANSSFAEPIIINLLPGGNTMPKGKEIKISLDAVELSETIKDMLSDSGAVTAKMKSDKKEHVIDLPIGVADERILRAVAGSLTSLKTLQMKKKNTFKLLKTLVLTYFPNPTSSDILKFLLAANFLDIGELLRPAAAAWIDQYQTENSSWARKKLWGLPEGKLSANLPRALKDVPRELLPHFDDYRNWLRQNSADYWKVRHQNLKPVSLPFQAQILGATNNKLYGSDASSISIFDLELNKIVKTIPTEKYSSKKMVMTPSGNKIYIANYESIIVIDGATNESRELKVRAMTLCLSGDKLYAIFYNNNGGDSSFTVIDTATDKLIVRPERLNLSGTRWVIANNKLYSNIWNTQIGVFDLTTNRPERTITVSGIVQSLASAGNKIYASHDTSIRRGGPDEPGSVSVIDATADRVIATLKVGNGPETILLSDNILFVANVYSGSISIIDTTLDQIVGEPIKMEGGPTRMAFLNGRLYVNFLGGKIVYFDVLEETSQLNAYYSK